MFVVDAFIVNVAIPSIRADLETTTGEIQGVIGLYQIAFAVLIITGEDAVRVSIAVSREHRRAKTDRLDTELLKRGFLRPGFVIEHVTRALYVSRRGRRRE